MGGNAQNKDSVSASLSDSTALQANLQAAGMSGSVGSTSSTTLHDVGGSDSDGGGVRNNH